MTGLHEWRGLKKYLRVEVEGTPKITRNPNDLIRDDYNFLNTEKLHGNILFPIHVKRGYWFLTYDYHTKFDYSFDNITNITMRCNKTLIDLYKFQEISFTLILHKLHPYTHYKVTFSPCNEIGCHVVENQYEFRTAIYKPTQAPYNVTLKADGKTNMKVNWSFIDEFHQNGEIRGHMLIVNVTRTNFTFVQNVTNYTYALLENIGKYEQVCIKIAAYTDYHDVGPFSNETCGYTNESGRFTLRFSCFYVAVVVLFTCL